jgi:hypothetical protein
MTTEMSNIIIHFGAPSRPGQDVAPEVKEIGLMLLRCAPNAVTWSAAPTTIQPNYSIYKDSLAAFMSCAAGELKFITNKTDPFQVCPKVEDKFPLPEPTICFSFSYALPDEVAQELRQGYGIQDTVIRGKPAMLYKGTASPDLILRLKELKVLMTTPAIDGVINLSSLRMLRYIVNLLSAFLKTHQYPAFLDESHEEEFTIGWRTGPMEDDDDMGGMPEERDVTKFEGYGKVKESKMKE